MCSRSGAHRGLVTRWFILGEQQEKKEQRHLNLQHPPQCLTLSNRHHHPSKYPFLIQGLKVKPKGIVLIYDRKAINGTQLISLEVRPLLRTPTTTATKPPLPGCPVAIGTIYHPPIHPPPTDGVYDPGHTIMILVNIVNIKSDT